MIKTHLIRFEPPYSPFICDIRQSVFTLEQGIDANEDVDGKDPDCTHILIEQTGKYIATGRMQADGHIGRLAVLKPYRGKGMGRLILQTFIEQAKAMQLERVYLGAQQQATAFYEKLGFIRYGEPFDEVGIEHIYMHYVLDTRSPDIPA